jgi:hypothetical protein
LPPVILGRGAELAAITENVRRAKAHRVPVPLVFVGQRGMGKTVLLRRLREDPGSATVALALEVGIGQTLVSMVREKLEDLTAGLAGPASKFSRALETAMRHIPKAKFELPHDAGAISISAEDPEAERPDLRSLAELLKVANRAAHDAKRYLTITIDEVQDVDLPSMHTVVRFVHEAGQSKAPVLLACAGLPSTIAVLEKLRTYVERWDRFELRLLTADESAIAIRDPIVTAGAKIADDALDRLVAETGGYPFFVQKFASAAWEYHSGTTISLADVEATIPDVREKLEQVFYADAFARLTVRERLFVMAMADRGPGPYIFRDIAQDLDTTTDTIGTIRQSLIKKEVIVETISGKIDFRVPLSDAYLRARRSTMLGPTVEAYARELAGRGSADGKNA